MIKPGDLVRCVRDVSLWGVPDIVRAYDEPMCHVPAGTLAIVLARLRLHDDMDELLVVVAGRVGWQVEPSFYQVVL